jgi:hypothetical protein
MVCIMYYVEPANNEQMGKHLIYTNFSSFLWSDQRIAKA